MSARPAESLDVSALAEALRGPLLRVSRKLRQEAQKVGLSAQDALILGHIKKHPGVGVSELADVDQISRPTMSSHVKRLEAAGWLSRADDVEDGRRQGLTATPAGARKLEALRRHRNDWLAARLVRLTPEERARLAEAAAPLLKLVSLEA
ncbi:MAG: MarR family transcriptional regulator [Phenylobacterium sp.]|jgi:DNA-binding MarR family transcriptional regulator|uniref:MarR family winged helix-turn-helix transcriptional regulator n=1 Tax=Phenylobacterium sp. TaxID=1871053 RepID=UPI0026081CE0|nr:MarR family transcriptional regulator [Phenylobacterium sp.]MDB5434457.1 MarR family transcriptional regulator [Phenylobacterium sp.]MDB5462426.1 MarR family transcriptional regulator [Phenylobacterium sp.]MDB5499761.1 MarR family transcriptional regulator [Phenylobacterium sp.]